LEEFIKKDAVLNEKKEKLFECRDPSKWELKSGEDSNLLLGNKELAFQKMLPLETDVLEEMRKMFTFLVRQFIVQTDLSSHFTAEEILQHLKSVCHLMRENFQSMENVWSELEGKLQMHHQNY